MGTDDTITVKVVLTEGRAPEFTKVVAADGGEQLERPQPWQPPTEEEGVYGDQQFEPLMVVAIGATVAVLARQISNLWMRHRHPGGQIVDLREIPPTVRPAPGLDHGELLVIQADGRESFYAKNADEATTLLGTVLGNV